MAVNQKKIIPRGTIREVTERAKNERGEGEVKGWGEGTSA